MKNIFFLLALTFSVAQFSFAQGNDNNTAKTTSTSVQPTVTIDNAHSTTTHPCTESKTTSSCCKSAAASGKSCCANKTATTTSTSTTESAGAHANCSHNHASNAAERIGNDPK